MTGQPPAANPPTRAGGWPIGPANLGTTAFRAPPPVGTGLVRKPNTLNFIGSTAVFAILQNTHRMIVGGSHRPVGAIRGVVDSATAHDLYRKNRAAALAFLIICPPRVRDALFRSLITYIREVGSIDGLEGLFLTGLNGVARERNTALTLDAVSLWESIGPATVRDGGGPTTVFFDMCSGTFSFLDGGTLGPLGNVLSKRSDGGILGSGLGSVFGTGPTVGSPGTGPGAGVLGGLGSDVGNALGGVVDNAAGGFLTDTFGGQLAQDLQTFAGLASQTLGGAFEGAALGSALGSAVPGLGSAIGGVIGFFIGFFSAGIDGAEKIAGDKGAATMASEISQLTDALQGLHDAAQKLNSAFPEASSGSTTTSTSASTSNSDVKNVSKDDQEKSGNPSTGSTDSNATPKQIDNTKKDASLADNPTPPPDGTMPAGDVGNDDVGGGGRGSGGDPNNFDVNMHWPQLDSLGGSGTTGDPGNQGDTLGARQTVSLHPIGRGVAGPDETGLGADTGLREPIIPPDSGSGPSNDAGGLLDPLGQRVVPHRIGAAGIGAGATLAARGSAIAASPAVRIVVH